MKRTLLGLGRTAATLLVHASAFSGDTLVEFDRGTDVDPVAGIANGAAG